MYSPPLKSESLLPTLRRIISSTVALCDAAMDVTVWRRRRVSGAAVYTVTSADPNDSFKFGSSWKGPVTDRLPRNETGVPTSGAAMGAAVVGVVVTVEVAVLVTVLVTVVVAVVVGDDRTQFVNDPSRSARSMLFMFWTPTEQSPSIFK